MALPKLNTFPKYEINIPSTGKKISYRPYLVSEEKVLLLAMESNDPKQILKAIKDTIEACVEGAFDASNLPMFDIEYLFIQMRAKSVGEGSKLQVKCPDCNAFNEIRVDLSQITPPKVTAEKNVKLTDQITVELRYPAYSKMLEIEDFNNVENTQTIFWMIRQCIEAISTEEERFLAADQPDQEMDDFVTSMTNDQFNKLTEFVRQMPKVSHTVEYTCQSCGKNHTHTFEGLADFF